MAVDPHPLHHGPDARAAKVDHPFPVIIGLGGNLGRMRETFGQACALLERGGVRVVRRSWLYWTRPWGVTDQPPFLNAAVAVRTSLPPFELLARCHWVERELGRRRTRHWGPRRLDLDLLIYGNARLAAARLILPHPRIAERDFVLAPLIDLGAPPVFSPAPRGWKNLLDQLPPNERTIIHREPWR